MYSYLMARTNAWRGMDLLTGALQTKPETNVERLKHAAAIVLIVATAVVLIAGIVAFSLVAAQCIRHGYSHVASYGPNGWKVWQFRIVCTK